MLVETICGFDLTNFLSTRINSAKEREEKSKRGKLMVRQEMLDSLRRIALRIVVAPTGPS